MPGAKYIRAFGYPLAFVYGPEQGVVVAGALGLFAIGTLGHHQLIRIASQLGLQTLRCGFLRIPTPFLIVTVELGAVGVTVGFGLKTGYY